MLGPCFTCLNGDDSVVQELTDLEGKGEDGVILFDKLKCIFPLNICEEKTMFICKECVDNLEVSVIFLQTVIRSQLNLRKQLGVEDEALTHLDYTVQEKLSVKDELSEENNETGDYSDNQDSDSSSDYVLSILKNHCEESSDSRKSKRKLRRSLTCAKCNCAFKSEKTLKNHESACKIDSDSDDKPLPFFCEDCKDSFSTTSELRTHDCSAAIKNEDRTEVLETKVKRGKRGRPPQDLVSVTCSFCDQTFEKHWILKKHINRVHGQEKKYLCTFCNRAFKQSYHLREHITSHTGEKNYQCNICGKAFQRISSQKRHMRSHDAMPGHKTKRTPFLCTICGKSFPFSNGVQRHMRTHFGIKTHECIICNRKFTQSTHLHVHMRIHTGEKPYVCDVCGAPFALNASLQKHKQIHEMKSQLKEDMESVVNNGSVNCLTNSLANNSLTNNNLNSITNDIVPANAVATNGINNITIDSCLTNASNNSLTNNLVNSSVNNNNPALTFQGHSRQSMLKTDGGFT